MDRSDFKLWKTSNVTNWYFKQIRDVKENLTTRLIHIDTKASMSEVFRLTGQIQILEDLLKLEPEGDDNEV